MFELIEREKNRQWKGLELIASENFTSRAVFECLGSALTNKYAEGLPGERYYGGTEFVDAVERLAQARALAAFGLDPEKWGVNVQPYSGSPANFAVYTGLLKPHDRIMGLDLPSGGHLTHGYYTLNKATKTKMSISATSIYFESLPYTVHPETGLVDFERLDDLAGVFKPNLIVCGGSAYPRDWDYKRFREIADKNGSLLLCDMAHYAGLVAAGELSSPFEVCDVVTTTTHKSLRGPRAGIIFFRKDERNFGARINAAVFPSLQGGPHINQIAAIATQFKEVATPEFRAYAKQVRANARALAAALTAKGYTIATGGTDNHLMLWDLRPQGVTGSKMQKMCDRVSITLNMNAVYGDRSALSPGGVRVGTPALTTRGFVEADFEQVAEFLHRACVLALEVQAALPSKLLADFVKAIEANEAADKLRDDVHAFASRFPMPGFDVDSLRIKDL